MFDDRRLIVVLAAILTIEREWSTQGAKSFAGWCVEGFNLFQLGVVYSILLLGWERHRNEVRQLSRVLLDSLHLSSCFLANKERSRQEDKTVLIFRDSFITCLSWLNASEMNLSMLFFRCLVKGSEGKSTEATAPETTASYLLKTTLLLRLLGMSHWW